VSYNEKHNWENGENNNDGESHNRSWNCGVEGPTHEPAIIALRHKQQRNFLTTLFLSQGVPMIVAGDEVGRTQRGNNNAYCQDNEISWIDWEHADNELLDFTKKLIHFYKAHPVFTRRRWFKGKPIRGTNVEDIAWFLPEGIEMTDDRWQHDYAKSLGVYLNGKALRMMDEKGRPVADDSFYIIFNAHDSAVPYKLPPEKYGTTWIKVLDTDEGGVKQKGKVYHAEETLMIPDRSVVVLEQPTDKKI
jgi:glycogen operon protein